MELPGDIGLTYVDHVSTPEYLSSSSYSTTDDPWTITMKDYAYFNCSHNVSCNDAQITFIDQDMTHEILRRVMYIFLAIIIACANGLTITAIAKFKSLMTPTNIFILSLSCADFLLSPTLLFIRFRVYITNDCAVKITFAIIMSLHILSLNMSLLNLMVIAIDRYIAILKPLIYRTTMTLRTAKIIVGLIWIYGSLLIFPTVGYFTMFKDGEYIRRNVSIMAILPPLAIFLVVIMQVVLYITISVILYIRIFWALFQRTHKIRAMQTGKDKGSVSAENKRTTKMMATVLGTIIVCWIPFAIYSYAIGNEILQKHLWARAMYTTLVVVLFCNSFLNSAIYAWKCPKFRNAYLTLLGIKLRQDNINSNIVTTSIETIN